MFRDLRPAHVAIAVALATAALWSVGIGGGYHFDDAITPISDPASQSLGAFADHLTDTLRPVTKLTYAIEGSLGAGETPAARRGVNIAIHAGAALLLCLLLVALAPALTPLGAGCLALLWAVHPIHGESVLAITGRPEALSTLFAIAALLAHRKHHVRAAVLLALAGLARETAIAALVPLAVLELSSRARWRVHARRLLPAAMATALVIVWFVATPRVRELASFSFDRPIGTSLAHQLAAVPVGLSLYVRTWALSIDHGDVLPGWLAIAGVAIYAAVIALVVALRHRAPLVALGGAVWLAAIVPTQSLVPKLDPLTERPLSFALVGIVLALAALHRHVRFALPIVLALAIATIARGRTYRSDLLLWADAASKSETNARPAMNYAYFLHRAGRDDEALRALERAHAIDPGDLEITQLRDALATRHHAP